MLPWTETRRAVDDPMIRWIQNQVCCHCWVTKSCLTLCDSMDCGMPGYRIRFFQSIKKVRLGNFTVGSRDWKQRNFGSILLLWKKIQVWTQLGRYNRFFLKVFLKQMNPVPGRNRDTDIEKGHVDTVEEGESGMTWESSTDICTRMCIK